MMKDELLEALEDLEIPIILQGSIAADEAYPDTFITFRTLSSNTAKSFDNDEVLTTYEINTCVFSRDPLIVASVTADARAALKKAGFIPQGKGYDLISDEPDFSGYATDYYYLEVEKNG